MAINRPRDPIQLAHRVFLESIGEAPKTAPPVKKDPAAVSLGRRGGLARAALPAKRVRRSRLKELRRVGKVRAKVH
jgi:hypothetical protein